MYQCIYWHAFFRVTRVEKVTKLLRKFDELCDTKTSLLSCERYWKDESLFDVSFSSPLKKIDISDAVFTSLVVANKLANSWEIAGPYISNVKWEFHGLTTKTKVTGIEWVQFRLGSES